MKGSNEIRLVWTMFLRDLMERYHVILIIVDPIRKRVVGRTNCFSVMVVG